MINGKTNEQILSLLNNSIYGHEYVKKVLINVINRSQQTYYLKWAKGVSEENLPCVRNVILVGASGTGKTFLIDELHRICNFPYIKLDATQLAPTSAVSGTTLKDIDKKIVEYIKNLCEIEYNKYRSLDGCADQLVIFIDEFDKLAIGKNSSDEWQQKIQATLLSLLENKRNECPNRITFILAGAFDSLTNKEQSSNSIGFFNNNSKTIKNNKITANDLIKYGLMSEIVGRISYILELDHLTKEDYKFLFKNKIMPKKIKEYEQLNIKCKELDEKELDILVDRVYNNKIGVRGLVSQYDELMIEQEFNEDVLFNLGVTL